MYDAIYVRVSSRTQQMRSQLPDLKRWVEANSDSPRWYRDTETGTTMTRLDWARLERDMRAGQIRSVIVWRLDRLGRTAKGLTALFAELLERRVNLVSIKEGVDLSTPAGRLMAHVIASVAQYETEVRGERVRAGQAAARAQGIKWGGSKPGRLHKETASKAAAVRTLAEKDTPIAAIARIVGLSRPTIYALLAK